MRWWLAELLMRLLALLPLGVLRALGWVLGRCLWWSGGRLRQVTERNLELCLPDLDKAQRRRLARASLVELARTGLEMAPVWFRPWRRLQGLIRDVEGGDWVDGLRAEGKGIVILAPHLGHWELLGLYLGERYGIHSMYLPHEDPALDERVRRMRSRHGATLVPADTRGVRTLLTVLRRGGMVGMLPDQTPKMSGAVFAPFFRRPAPTMTLAGNLVARTGAVPVCAYALRVPGGFTIHFVPAEPGMADTDSVVAATALNRTVERCVRECPEQYQWEYKRFKKQPDGSKVYQ
jgi:Kdo2-lipid IVA lauroyltransferase/acyltransferase